MHAPPLRPRVSACLLPIENGSERRCAMTVLLVIVTFAVFILIASLLTRRAMARKAALHATREAFVRPEPVWVAGYELPDGLHYHRGHTWVRVEDGETVAVGIDDFARRLIGPARGVRLPAVGTWL